MKYITLLRGINVGGNRKVEMKRLKALLESLGLKNVSTYINSGNIMFESGQAKTTLHKKIVSAMKKEFGFNIQTLLKTKAEIKKISQSIPKDWKNDASQRTDVAYLFPEIDSKKIIDELPVKKEYIDIRYVKGAIYWNVQRKNVYKSQLAKIISHKLYQSMTVRNINTARFLAQNK